jgi:hypothetical protein
MLGTGYFTDLKPDLDQWLADGVITRADHDALRRGGQALVVDDCS